MDDKKKAKGEKKRLARFFRKELDIDVEREYRRLKDLGRISVDKLRDRDSILDAVNEAAYNEQQAKRIYFKARRLYELFQVEYKRGIRKLEKRATARIKAWLDGLEIGSRKQITKDDVVGEICQEKDSRTEYRKLVKRLEEMREIRDVCEGLMKSWQSRSKLLNAQSYAVNATVQVNLGDGKPKRR